MPRVEICEWFEDWVDNELTPKDIVDLCKVSHYEILNQFIWESKMRTVREWEIKQAMFEDKLFQCEECAEYFDSDKDVNMDGLCQECQQKKDAITPESEFDITHCEHMEDVKNATQG